MHFYLIPPKSRTSGTQGRSSLATKRQPFQQWPAPSFTAASPLTGLRPVPADPEPSAGAPRGVVSLPQQPRRVTQKARPVGPLPFGAAPDHPVPADTFSFCPPRLCTVCFHTCHPGRFPIVFSNLRFERKGTAPHGVIKTSVSAGKTQFLLKPEN